MTNLNENLKKYRLKNNLTQQDVSEKMFVTRQCISRWESGNTIPDIHSIEKLSKIYNCSIDDLLNTGSITKITLDEAIKNKKNRTVIMSSLVISFLAIIVSLFSVIYGQYKNNIESILNKDTKVTKALINEVLDNYQYEILYFEDEAESTVSKKNINIYFDTIVTLANHKDDIVEIHEKDIVEIRYKEELNDKNIINITIIERSNGKIIKGYVATPFKEKYQTIASLKENNEFDKVYYLFEPNKIESNIKVGSIKISSENYDFHPSNMSYEMDFTIKYDAKKMNQDIYFGTIYEDKIEYDTFVIDKDIYYNELNLKSFMGITGIKTDDFFYESVPTKIRLMSYNVVSYKEIIIYEYNQLDELINTLVITEDDELSIKAHPDAIYAVIKEKFNENIENKDFQTKKIYVGDEYQLIKHIGYGFTVDTTFKYIG